MVEFVNVVVFLNCFGKFCRNKKELLVLKIRIFLLVVIMIIWWLFSIVMLVYVSFEGFVGFFLVGDV